MTDEKFFGERISDSQMNEVSSLAAAEKTYHRFVVITLKNGEPVIKVSFTYPKMTKREQNLFLSDDFTKLIDIRREEASIYEIKPEPGSIHTTARFIGDVMKLPFAAYDGDANQLFCMMSPDLSKHFDIDPIKKEWLIRDTYSGDTLYRFNTDFLSFDPMKVFEQARFMAWEDNTSVRLIDVNADPLIEELIEIPERVGNEEKVLTRRLASGTVPYIDDIEPYKQSYEKTTKERPRPVGTHNYFKGK